MTVDVSQLLAVLFGLQFKHLLGDYVLQTPRMLAEKGRYGAVAGMAHAACHAALTVVVLLICGVGALVSVLLALAEGVAHYHVDWGKDRIGRSLSLTPDDARYWALAGMDQFLHQITYLAIVAAVIVIG